MKNIKTFGPLFWIMLLISPFFTNYHKIFHRDNIQNRQDSPVFSCLAHSTAARAPFCKIKRTFSELSYESALKCELAQKHYGTATPLHYCEN